MEGKHQTLHEQAVLCEAMRSFTFWHEGEPVLCGGALEMWEGRFVLWSLLSKDASKCFWELHIAAKQFLDGLDARRIEAYVRCDFEPGHRWARVLGFKPEVQRMQKFFPNGTDATLYAKVQGEKR